MLNIRCNKKNHIAIKKVLLLQIAIILILILAFFNFCYRNLRYKLFITYQTLVA